MSAPAGDVAAWWLETYTTGVAGPMRLTDEQLAWLDSWYLREQDGSGPLVVEGVLGRG